MEADKRLINGAAAILRRRIDEIWNAYVDTGASNAEADAETNDLYDAVTLLHEQAMKGVS